MRSLVGFLVVAALPLHADDLRLMPSHSPVRGVVLQHIPPAVDGIPDSRLNVIRDVRRAFPKLDLRITSHLPLEQLWKTTGLKDVVTAAVHVTAKDGGHLNQVQDPFEFGWDHERNRLAIFSMDHCASV